MRRISGGGESLKLTAREGDLTAGSESNQAKLCLHYQLHSSSLGGQIKNVTFGSYWETGGCGDRLVRTLTRPLRACERC